MTNNLKQRLAEISDIVEHVSTDLSIVSPSPMHPLEVHSKGECIAMFAGSSTYNAEGFVMVSDLLQLANAQSALLEECAKVLTTLSKAELGVYSNPTGIVGRGEYSSWDDGEYYIKVLLNSVKEAGYGNE